MNPAPTSVYVDLDTQDEILDTALQLLRLGVRLAARNRELLLDAIEAVPAEPGEPAT